MENKNRCALGSENILDKSPEKKEQLTKYLEILDIFKEEKRRKGKLIQALHKAQELYGFLPESVQLFIATSFKIHLSEVYGVISFYSYFTDKPVGKFKINVCTGTACHVKGADKILKKFSDTLNLKEGETSKDLRFSLGGLRCVGACSLAPVVLVNERVYGNVTEAMIPQIIKECE
jgi:NADH-quinone oxidoreductase subunit E